MNLTDFLGNKYGPGDLVIYGAMSGRSVNMVVGRVEDIYRVYYDLKDDYKWKRLEDDAPVPRRADINGVDLGEFDSGTRVKVQPLRAARWTQHHGHDYYVDTRTGKRIDPWKSPKHIKVDGHHIDTRTGETITAGTGQYKHLLPPGLPWVPPEFVKYVHVEFQPWVEQRHDGPKAVTLEITGNIVRWEGELPDATV